MIHFIKYISPIFLECKEYGQWVFADDSGDIDASVSMCSLIELPLIVGGMRAARDEFPHMARKIKNKCFYNVLHNRFLFLFSRLLLVSEAHQTMLIWHGFAVLR